MDSYSPKSRDRQDNKLKDPPSAVKEGRRLLGMRKRLQQHQLASSSPSSKISVKRRKQNEQEEDISLNVKQERFSKKVVKELLATEETYLNHLNILCKFFLEPLQSRSIIHPKDINIIFGDIRAIRNINEELLLQLKNFPDRIGHTFLEVIPYLKLYSLYASCYLTACAHLQKLSSERKDFDDFIKNQESRPEVQQKLTALLVTPVQRIPRYRLLLRELLDHLSPKTEGYLSLQKAFLQISSVANHIDTQIQEYNSLMRMLTLQRALVGGQPRIVSPGRQLLKEGILSKISRKGRGSRERIFFLFNDMLIYCKTKISLDTPKSSNSIDPNYGSRLICRCVFPIKHCLVQPLSSDGKRQKIFFKIKCKDDTLTLFTEDFVEGQNWIKAIRTACRHYTEARKTLRKQSTARRPLRRAALIKQKSDKCLTNEERHSEHSEGVQELHDDLGVAGTPLKFRLRHKVLGLMTISDDKNFKLKPPLKLPRPKKRKKVIKSPKMKLQVPETLHSLNCNSPCFNN